MNKRKDEVHARLDEAVKTMPARETTSLKDQKTIRDAVNTYCYLRETALKEAIGLLKSTSKTAEQQRERWENHLQTKGSEAVQVLKEAMNGKRLTLFTSITAEVISQESSFFGKLGDMRMADTMRAKIIEYQRQFEEEKKNLLDKWDDLLTTNKSVNASIGEISEKLMVVYNEGLEILEKTHTTLREIVADSLRLWAAKEDAEPSPPAIYTPLSMMLDTLNNFAVTSKDMVYRFDQLYRSEDSVAVIMFGETRKSVKEFLENTNLDKAQKDYNQAEQQAYEIAKNMLTKGQQDDALQFVNESIEITKPTMRTFTDFYNEFIDEFKEIFIGPVGDRTVNDLLNKKDWEDHRDGWLRINIQEKLKKIHDDSRDWVNLSIYNLSDAAKEQVEISLAKERERLESAINRASDPSVLDTLKIFLTLSKDSILSKVKAS